MSKQNDLKCLKCGGSHSTVACAGGGGGSEEEEKKKNEACKKQDEASKADHQNTGTTSTTAISKSCQSTLCTILWANQTAVAAAPEANASKDLTKEAKTVEASDPKTSDTQNTQESTASKPCGSSRLTM